MNSRSRRSSRQGALKLRVIMHHHLTPPRPSQNRTSGFPSIRLFSPHSEPTVRRIEWVPNPHRWPPDPVERVKKLRPVVAASLALSVQPFEQQPRHLDTESVAHPGVIGDGVVIEMAYQFQFGPLEQLAFLLPTPLLPQPFFYFIQLCTILLRGGASLHFEVTVRLFPQ